MYYIPKGKPMHEKLSTSFVRMEGLLEELKAENFDGYVLLNFPKTSGFLFLEGGRIIDAAEIGDGERRAGVAVQEELIQLSQSTKGTLSVYYLQKELVKTIAGIASGEPVYENLSSDWANVGRLLKKLAAEKKTYFLSLAFEQGTQRRGLIFVDGDHTEAVCAVGDDQLTGKEALDKLIRDSETELATFSLYRQATAPGLSAMGSSASRGTAPTPAVSSASASSSSTTTSAMPQVGGFTPSNAQQPAATPYYEAFLPSGNEARVPELNLSEPKARAGAFEDILDVVDADSPVRPGVNTMPSLSAAQMTPAPLPEAPKTGGEMRDLMTLMSRVVAAVEKGMTAAGRGSSFPTALRAGLLAVTERYPFLDPFAAEFEYQDKEIVFVGTAQPSEFATGLSEALRQMVEDLIYSSNGRVRDYIAEELRKVERENANEIRQFNLGNLTEKICQH